jgi:hypothetical protein
LILRELVTVTKSKKSLKNDVAFIVFLKKEKNPTCDGLLHLFCYVFPSKTAVSYLARAMSSMETWNRPLDVFSRTLIKDAASLFTWRVQALSITQ